MKQGQEQDRSCVGRGLLDLVQVGPSSTQLARNALVLGLNDLEDAMQDDSPRPSAVRWQTLMANC
jgi:hypothetical protein